MRWFKHMTGMLDDVFIVELVDKFGAEGYGIWCGILENYAAYANEVNCGDYVYIPWAVVTRKLRVSRAKVQRILDECATFGKLLQDKDATSLVIKISKMLDLRDEWTERRQKNSGVTRELLGPKKQKQNTDITSPSEKTQSVVHPIWGDGLEMLVKAGDSDSGARAFLGRALKIYGEGALNEAISAAILEQPVEPKSFLVGVLKARPKQNRSNAGLPGNQMVPNQQRLGGIVKL